MTPPRTLYDSQAASVQTKPSGSFRRRSHTSARCFPIGVSDGANNVSSFLGKTSRKGSQWSIGLTIIPDWTNLALLTIEMCRRVTFLSSTEQGLSIIPDWTNLALL